MYVNGVNFVILSVVYGFLLSDATLNNLTYVDEIVSVHSSASVLVTQKNKHVVIDCPVTSNARILEYFWTKDGIDIIPQKRVDIVANGSLIITKIINKRRKGRNDTGYYECYARNKHGTFIGQQLDLIISKQSFYIQPVRAEVVLGGVARFQFRVNSTSVKSPYYAWESPVTDNHRIFKHNGVLQLINVAQEDAGKYSCKIVAIDILDIQEKSAFLNIVPGVLPRIPRLLPTPQNVTVVVGDSALLECLVEGGTDVNIHWQYLDKSPVVTKDNGRLSIAGHSNIKFSLTISKDTGIYVCVVKHANGPDITRVYYLDILVPPKLTVAPKPVYHQDLSIRVRLPCAVTGNPAPTIHWYKDGYQIYPAPNFIKDNNLVLHGRSEESGYYQCIANNSVGHAVATTKVTYFRKENTHGKIHNVKAISLSSTEINVTWPLPETQEALDQTVAYCIDHHPIVDYMCPEPRCKSVFKIHRDVTDLNYKVFGDLKPYTRYQFEVQLFSGKGAGVLSDPVIAMTKEAVPTSVPEIQITPDSITSFRVTWSELPVSERNGVINRYKLEYGTELKMTVIELHGNVSSYLVTGLEPDTLYKVRLIAGNSAGFPDIDDNVLTYRTPKGNNTNIATPNLTFTPINSTAVWLLWNHEPNHSVSSYRVMVQKHLMSSSVKEYNLSAEKTVLLIANLENRTFYQIDFMVKNLDNDVIGIVTELYQSRSPGALLEPPPPMILDPLSLTSTVIALSWKKPKTSMTITKYTVKYQERENDVMKNDIQFSESSNLNVRLVNLQAFTWYAIAVCSHTAEGQGPYSKPVIVQTKEGIPSPPENLLAKVVSPGTVKLEWGPPSQQNGIITYYIIYYNPNNPNQPDNSWSSIQRNASATSVQVGNLTNKVYYFKLRACNNAGEGVSTEVVAVDTLTCDCPACPPTHACLQAPPTVIEDTVSQSPGEEKQVGIFIGCGVGLVCIIACVIFVVVRHRQLQAQYRQSTETHLITTGNDQFVGRYLSQHTQGHTNTHGTRYSPIISRLPENMESDSKGATGVVFLKNCNGLVHGNRISIEQRALLSPSSSSSHGNDGSGNPTPDTGTLDSSFTTPDSLDSAEVPYNRINHCDSLDLASSGENVSNSNTALIHRNSKELASEAGDLDLQNSQKWLNDDNNINNELQPDNLTITNVHDGTVSSPVNTFDC